MIIFLKTSILFTSGYLLTLILKRQFYPSSIFFYEALVILFLITIVFLIFFYLKKDTFSELKKNNIFITIFFAALLNYSFLITFPSLSDRSLSLYMLNILKKNEQKGLFKEEILLLFQNDFLIENQQLDTRLNEQLYSKNIYIKNKKYFSTFRGKVISDFNYFLIKVFNL